MRKLLVALVIVLTLVPAGQAAAARRVVDRGIVVRVNQRSILLRELDGSQRSFRITGATIVTLDNHPATILDVERGDVAYVEHFGKAPVAFRIRAFTQ